MGCNLRSGLARIPATICAGGHSMSDGNFNTGGSDVYVERSSQSWFGRIGNAFKAILFGLILVVGAAILLFWNEGRAAKTYAALAEGAGLVASLDASAVDPAYEHKLIHLSGPVTLGSPAEDPEFRFHADALKLDRTVEMYQWKEESHSETQKKLGGGEETITRYTYTREWSARAIDSGVFRDPERPPQSAASQCALACVLSAERQARRIRARPERAQQNFRNRAVSPARRRARRRARVPRFSRANSGRRGVRRRRRGSVRKSAMCV